MRFAWIELSQFFANIINWTVNQFQLEPYKGAPEVTASQITKVVMRKLIVFVNL